MPGPAPNPNSLRGKSRARRGEITRLPAAGYRGDVPAWPLPTTDARVDHPLEADIWMRVWRLPQAAVWARTGVERTVALYCRVSVRAEAGSLAAVTEARQLADMLGLSPMSMLRLKWEIELLDDASIEAPADLSALEDLNDLLG